MCYAVYLSTDSGEDLCRQASPLVHFHPLSTQPDDPCTQLLQYPHRWYVGSKSGCSCTFRHLASPELGFGIPESWYAEDQGELDATQELFRCIAALLARGHRVDLVDRWEGAVAADIRTLAVSVGKIPEEAFRLFENYRFQFLP